MVPIGAGPQLHLKRICEDKFSPGPPVFMLHGLAEDGKIFYSARGRGLAWYLALQGYDVYVADLRGRGKSWPAVGAKSSEGLHEAINEDLPALIKAIVRKRGPVPQIWISHAWGGVLTSSFFARYGEEFCPVSAMVYFGCRRAVGDGGWRKALALRGFWKTGLRFASAITGYMPAKDLKLGTSNETRQTFVDALRWMFDSQWKDPVDEYDYSIAAKTRKYPPSLYFACAADTVYGHPDDVRAFIAELGEHNGRLIVLSESTGSQQDYGHIEMLIAEQAVEDHFPLLQDWLASEGSIQSFEDEEPSDDLLPA